MRWPSLLAAALAALSVIATSDARACSCVQTSPEVALAEHDAVFEGRVLEVEPASSPMGRMRATLEVVQHWKGVETERVVVTTAAMESTCGVAFEVDTSWLIYADLEEGELRTGLCSRTRRIEDAAEDVAALGAGVVPVEITEDDEVEAEPEDERPARGGCASCAVGARDPDDRSRAWIAVALVALATARARNRSWVGGGRGRAKPGPTDRARAARAQRAGGRGQPVGSDRGAPKARPRPGSR